LIDDDRRLLGGRLLNNHRRLLLLRRRLLHNHRLLCGWLLGRQVCVGRIGILSVHEKQNNYRYQRDCDHHDHANGRSGNAAATTLGSRCE